jgi:6-carboxyhexanoate--CoA ligase
MRASKNRGQKSEVRSQNLKTHEIHISGAEGIYEEAEILKIVKGYTKRALNHPRGKPDNIVITIEAIKYKPKKASLLPVTTLKCNSPDEAKKIIYQTLSGLGVSKKGINNSFKVLTSPKTMRGAALILEGSGIRMEPDRERGVRVSRLGIEKTAEKVLVKKLSNMRVNTTTVKEALILASKVTSHPDVIAEICISDDPDYTTGYIASKQLGYLRIPNIKRRGEKHGGRVFIIEENADIDKLINYLEKTPVIVSGVRFD